MEKNYKIEFEYADNLSSFQWRKQRCSLYANSVYEAEKKCIELYGLGFDCEYRIISIIEQKG